jgi:polyphosphate kinase
MGRNLDRRVETIVPVLDPAVQDTIATIVEVLRADNVNTRWLRSDGTYTRRNPGEDEPLVCAHDAFLEASQAI